MDEMSAALGITQITKLRFFLKKRRELAVWYRQFLNREKRLIASPQTAPGNTHSWFVYVARLLKGNRDAFISELFKRGISTKPYLPTIHLFDFYRKRFGFKRGDFPVAEEVSKTSIALPFYIGLKKKEVQYITHTLIKLLQKKYGKYF
jgi:perosamine synthetase